MITHILMICIAIHRYEHPHKLLDHILLISVTDIYSAKTENCDRSEILLSTSAFHFPAQQASEARII